MIKRFQKFISAIKGATKWNIPTIHMDYIPFRDFQTLLQNISDYLLVKTKCWVEKEFGAGFLNIPKCQNFKNASNFCSSSIKAEEELLKVIILCK